METLNEEAQGLWAKERGVVSSPEPESEKKNFGLFSMQMSQSLPSIRIAQGNCNFFARTCPCAVDCNSQCCKSAQVLPNTRICLTDETPLVSSASSLHRSGSFYGSMGSSDPLITEEDGGGVSVYVYV